MLNRRRAYTLVELMVVIGIIVLLMALLLPAISAVREAARRTECQNNLRQIGVALHEHESAFKAWPPGWIANDPSEKPGWGWSAYLLDFLGEGKSVFRSRMELTRPIDDPSFALIRQRSFSVFLCPSDSSPPLITLPPNSNTPAMRFAVAMSLPPPSPALLTVARTNYAAHFGTGPIEETPDTGNGVFYRNSHVRPNQILQGVGKVLFVGERSTRTGPTTWIGIVPGADRAMARILGNAERLPNDVLDDVASFSSEHSSGVNFLVGDGTVKFIPDDTDRKVFRSMSTRDGHVPPDTGDPSLPPNPGTSGTPPNTAPGNPPADDGSGNQSPSPTKPPDDPGTGISGSGPTGSGPTGSGSAGGANPTSNNPVSDSNPPAPITTPPSTGGDPSGSNSGSPPAGGSDSSGNNPVPPPAVGNPGSAADGGSDGGKPTTGGDSGTPKSDGGDSGSAGGKPKTDDGSGDGDDDSGSSDDKGKSKDDQGSKKPAAVQAIAH